MLLQVELISLSHSAYIISRIIMTFRRSCYSSNPFYLLPSPQINPPTLYHSLNFYFTGTTDFELVIFLALLVRTKLACTTGIMGALIAVFDSLLETPEERKREISLPSRVTSEIPISTCAWYDQADEINLKRERIVSGKAHA